MCSSMKMLTQKEIMELFGITRGHLHKLRKNGTIPEPSYVLGSRMPRWKVEDIIAIRDHGITRDKFWVRHLLELLTIFDDKIDTPYINVVELWAEYDRTSAWLPEPLEPS